MKIENDIEEIRKEKTLLFMNELPETTQYFPEPIFAFFFPSKENQELISFITERIFEISFEDFCQLDDLSSLNLFKRSIEDLDVLHIVDEENFVNYFKRSMPFDEEEDQCYNEPIFSIFLSFVTKFFQKSESFEELAKFCLSNISNDDFLPIFTTICEKNDHPQFDIWPILFQKINQNIIKPKTFIKCSYSLIQGHKIPPDLPYFITFLSSLNCSGIFSIINLLSFTKEQYLNDDFIGLIHRSLFTEDVNLLFDALNFIANNIFDLFEILDQVLVWIVEILNQSTFVIKHKIIIFIDTIITRIQPCHLEFLFSNNIIQEVGDHLLASNSSELNLVLIRIIEFYFHFCKANGVEPELITPEIVENLTEITYVNNSQIASMVASLLSEINACFE